MSGDFFLTAVEGEKFRGAKMDRRRHMKNIEGSMTTLRCSLARVGRRQTQHGINIERNHAIQTRRDIGLPVGDHLVGDMAGVTLFPIRRMEPDLQLDGLKKFKFQQPREIKRLGHGITIVIGQWRMLLLPVERTKKTRVRISDHGSPVSKARISSTSSRVKTRSPQIRFRRAA